jgi:carbon-monoxide dehydrogenase medium subunit
MQFEYLEPRTIEKAVDLLRKHGPEAMVIAGGTDLLVRIRRKTTNPRWVVSLWRIPGLNHISYDDKQGMRIGALTTIRAIEKSAEIQQRYPIVFQAAHQLGCVAIRNMATIGGNLCNAAPSADMAPALISLSASAKIFGSHGEKIVPLEHFFKGPGCTIIEAAELLTEIQIPVSSANSRSIYLKHMARGALDLAIVGVAVLAVKEPKSQICQDIKVVLGAVAPTPIRARNAEEVLKGKAVDETTINNAAKAAADETSPISDVRASAEYRRRMVEVFTKRAIKQIIT